METDIGVMGLPAKERQRVLAAPEHGKGQEGGSPRSSCISTLAVWLGVGSVPFHSRTPSVWHSTMR